LIIKDVKNPIFAEFAVSAQDGLLALPAAKGG
jgi:hypothetical protein